MAASVMKIRSEETIRRAAPNVDAARSGEETELV
jgi:hypothetical protein